MRPKSSFKNYRQKVDDQDLSPIGDSVRMLRKSLAPTPTFPTNENSYPPYLILKEKTCLFI